MGKSPPETPNAEQRASALPRVMVATTAMLTFISFWRAAAIVLNDLASSAFYAGGIAEDAIGKSAPWFILAVMLFAYAVCQMYIESCSMFVRGGVYRVVKEAMGSTLAKFSVSALMFDYVLTGPISGVSAGQYLAGFLNDIAQYIHVDFTFRTDSVAMVFAIGVTVFESLLGAFPYGEIEPFQHPRFADPIPPTRYRPDIPGWLESILLKAVARDPKLRFETTEEFLLALERGERRPIVTPLRTPLATRDPARLWQSIATVAVVINLLLLYVILAK